MTYHHYQYEAETEVVANDEHLPSSLMRGEIGNQGVRRLRQHQLSAGSSPGQLTACDVWCRHGTGGAESPVSAGVSSNGDGQIPHPNTGATTEEERTQ